MTHAQKPDFVFRRNGQVHLNRRGRQFSRLLAAEVCASAVVMLDTSCSEVVWRVLATHSIRQFALHFPSRALPYAFIFQLEFTSSAGQSKNMKYVTAHWLPFEAAPSVLKFNLFCFKNNFWDETNKNQVACHQCRIISFPKMSILKLFIR